MTGRLPWSDAITVLQARGGKQMAKTLLRNGQFRDYDSAFRFDATTLHLDGLESLADALARLIRQPDRCVVRGELIGGGPAINIRRLAKRDDETGDEPTLRDVPRRWLALDFDDVLRPAHVAPHDLLACADIVFALLPAPFARASAIVQASAGHGIKPGCRLRIWFWCDRPVTGAELKRWLTDAPVDPSIFWPVQPIYTAAPIIESGAVDPLPARLIEWPGEAWLRVPSAEELAPPVRKPPEFVRPAHKPGSSRAALYVDGALESAGDRIRSAKHRHPTILQEACSLARMVHAGLLEQSRLHASLWNAAVGAGKDDESEIARMVDFAMQNANTDPLPEWLTDG